MRSEHRCDCGKVLAGAFERELKSGDPRRGQVDRVHAIGRTYLERRPLGFEVVGECPSCGIVSIVPLGIPREERYAG